MSNNLLQALKSGWLQVDTIHEIYFEHWGNPKGKAFVYLHGGPGLGFKENDLRFFQSEGLQVVLLDQRGCGRSRPLGHLEQNNTSNLIADIIQLLDHLGIEKAVLFGGSWGATLALLTAIAHPQRIEGLILRGLFLANQMARTHFERGGIALDFPEVWERYRRLMPNKTTVEISTAYFEEILAEHSNRRRELSYELIHFGFSVARQGQNLEDLPRLINNSDFETKARLLAYYSLHDFFILDDFIIQQASQINTIPTHIIHGLQDRICLPHFARLLHAEMPDSKLYLVEGGHVPSDPFLEKRLLQSVVEMI